MDGLEVITKTPENSLIIKNKTVYHDLDHLAGTWSHEDLESFEDNMKFFEKIDLLT